jgi:anti-sigma-K factor RskA
MPMPKALAPMFSQGAALAVSVEPPTGSPTDAPSGPIAARGRLQPI